MAEGRDVLQRDLDKLKNWAIVNQKRFSKAKCKGLFSGWNNPRYEYRLEEELLESGSALKKKEMGVLVESVKLQLSRQGGGKVGKGDPSSIWKQLARGAAADGGSPAGSGCQYFRSELWSICPDLFSQSHPEHSLLQHFMWLFYNSKPWSPFDILWRGVSHPCMKTPPLFL